MEETIMAINQNNGENENWQTKTLITGAVLGALIGLGGAYLLVKSSEQEGHRVNITTGDGVRLGLLVMGLLRQLAQLGEGK
jgi:ABC-type uncharacterized transport system permease subunit